MMGAFLCAAQHDGQADPRRDGITVGDVELVRKVLDAASRFVSQTSQTDMAELVTERGMVSLFP